MLSTIAYHLYGRPATQALALNEQLPFIAHTALPEYGSLHNKEKILAANALKLNALLEEEFNPTNCLSKIKKCIASMIPFLQRTMALFFYLGGSGTIIFLLFYYLLMKMRSSVKNWNALLSIENITCAVSYNKIAMCKMYDAGDYAEHCGTGIARATDPQCYQALNALCQWGSCFYNPPTFDDIMRDCDERITDNLIWSATPGSCLDPGNPSIIFIVCFTLLSLAILLLMSRGGFLDTCISTHCLRTPSTETTRLDFFAKHETLLGTLDINSPKPLENILKISKQKYFSLTVREKLKQISLPTEIINLVDEYVGVGYQY